MLVSIVVPCFNEEKMLPLFFEELTSVIGNISGYDFEVMFIDDGSSDSTLKIIRNLHNSDSRVRYISFSKNFGKEAAIYAGLSNAKGDLITIMDADLQDPPAILPEMIHYIIEEGYDSVSTRRVTRKGEPIIKSYFSRLFYRIVNKFTDIDIVDGARDYRLMTRQFKDAVLSMSEYHRFSKGLFSWVGFRTKWLEYENVTRKAGETKWSFWKLLKYAIDGIVAFTTVPLRFASVTGIIVSVLSFIYLLFIFIRTIISGVDVPGYASSLSVQLFLGGMLLTAIGVLGEYIARTYMEVKKRPIYIAKERDDDLNEK